MNQENKKTILGLDLGTNSIGWALVEHDNDGKVGKIVKAGSRILPMGQDVLGKFDSGQSISQTAERTGFRGVRRLRERHLLRRERLHRVLNIMEFLPAHYADSIDFDKRLGQFVSESEPKIAYRLNPETEKSEFIFKESFDEMLADFRIHQPELVKEDRKVPHDWTIYYLRKKALTEKISESELAWILLNFNQKRGYYQLRGEEEEEIPTKRVEYFSLTVTDVQASEEKKGKDEIWYNVFLENGWIYRRTSKVPLDWTGKRKEFIVTTDLNEDGTVRTDKDGKEKRSFRAPDENDWTLVKKKTEFDIEKSDKTVGQYIYDSLLGNPTQKIKGKLVRVVERKFYRRELELILAKQKQFHQVLSDDSVYGECLEELYGNNEIHRENIAGKGINHLLMNDIIFYQRPLKSKNSLISNCSFEKRFYLKDGVKITEPLKCIAKSHPLFQEFRLWQFVQNLKIYKREKLIDGRLFTDVNVTDEFLKNEEDVVGLFEWLNQRKEIDQKALMKFPEWALKKSADQFRWNYVEDKSYPCNETRALILARLDKVDGIDEHFLTKDNEEALWHILYSVEDKNDIQKALSTFANKRGLSLNFAEHFRKIPPFKKEYGSYSAKAINKLLPLLRKGSYWSIDSFDKETLNRIDKILTGEYDASIRDRVREKAINLKELSDFKGLPLWLVSYIVYDRHSEDGEAVKWKIADDIQSLQQHSLRNPIVEQVINETLLVVKDVWKYFGKGKEEFFDEIHIELGREMKNPSEKRKQMTSQISQNENTNMRIKALLTELLNSGDAENVRPYSPSQQEILKIYEEGALNGSAEIPEDILKIAKMAQPSTSELVRYKLWLQQKYRSPYTGEPIPLGKLFTRAYDIEHIIPQSRYFDDSLSNKVICEVEVNRDKDNSTAYEYIRNNRGKKIELSFGKVVTLFTISEYEDFVKTHYAGSRGKMKKLLMDDIPEAFIQRQLNDSRYISKVVKNLMSNIVRTSDEQETISKNVVTCNGAITSMLKQDWGLNDVWNEIVTPRFERLNELTKSSKFGEWTNKEGKRVFQTQIPLELQKGFSKKRIDHRHHALDAIVIACASRSHINYLNNESALGKSSNEIKDKRRYDLKHKLCYKNYNGENKESYRWRFFKPWETFTQDTRGALQNIIVSFKKNVRVINKTVNHYQAITRDDEGNLKKTMKKQTKGESWAIRKPMHKDTVSGLVKLNFTKVVSLSNALDNWETIVDKDIRSKVKELIGLNYDKKLIQKYFKDHNNLLNDKDVSKVEVRFWDKENVASRVIVNDTFDSARIATITDTGIQKIMLRQLQKFDEEKGGKLIEHPELAFSPDGIDEMNKNLVVLNGGKDHKPIFKVRTYESKGNKFVVGNTGNKKAKYVEAAKGTNLFFAVYADENGKRNYETIPLNVVIERLTQKLLPVPEKNEAGFHLQFHLSPNDLVFISDRSDETANMGSASHSINQAHRIYKIVSFTGARLSALPHTVAKSIVDKVEFTQLNKLEFTFDRLSIKDTCMKLTCDRLGNVSFKC